MISKSSSLLQSNLSSILEDIAYVNVGNNDYLTLEKTLKNKNLSYFCHSKRVSHFATKFARKLHLDKTLIQEIKLAGLFHDIGKIAIPNKILNSPNKLTEEEFKKIKEHSKIGSNLLNSSKHIGNIAQYVLEHHERWDGAGYPSGLSKTNISLPARIIAIADSYDAMISDRPYRKALSEKFAVNELIRCSGSQFDPELITLFLKKVLKIKEEKIYSYK